MHDTVTVKIDGKPVEVDRDMATLVLELHKLGLKTKNCCQGGEVKGNAFAYLSIQLDENSYFQFYKEKNTLTIRWNRTIEKFNPIESCIITKTGLVRVSEIKEM